MPVQRMTIEMDPELQSKLKSALEMAEEATKRGKPTIPFVMTDEEVSAFALNPYQEATKEAIAFASKHRATNRQVYDGYLTIEGVRTDALYFRIYKQGDEFWTLLAQRYQPRKLFKRYQRLGDMWLVVTEPI